MQEEKKEPAWEAKDPKLPAFNCREPGDPAKNVIHKA